MKILLTVILVVEFIVERRQGVPMNVLDVPDRVPHFQRDDFPAFKLDVPLVQHVDVPGFIKLIYLTAELRLELLLLFSQA